MQQNKTLNSFNFCSSRTDVTFNNLTNNGLDRDVAHAIDANNRYVDVVASKKEIYEEVNYLNSKYCKVHVQYADGHHERKLINFQNFKVITPCLFLETIDDFVFTNRGVLYMVNRLMHMNSFRLLPDRIYNEFIAIRAAINSQDRNSPCLDKITEWISDLLDELTTEYYYVDWSLMLTNRLVYENEHFHYARKPATANEHAPEPYIYEFKSFNSETERCYYLCLISQKLDSSRYLEVAKNLTRKEIEIVKCLNRKQDLGEKFARLYTKSSIITKETENTSKANPSVKEDESIDVESPFALVKIDSEKERKLRIGNVAGEEISEIDNKSELSLSICEVVPKVNEEEEIKKIRERQVQLNQLQKNNMAEMALLLVQTYFKQQARRPEHLVGSEVDPFFKNAQKLGFDLDDDEELLNAKIGDWSIIYSELKLTELEAKFVDEERIIAWRFYKSAKNKVKAVADFFNSICIALQKCYHEEAFHDGSEEDEKH